MGYYFDVIGICSTGFPRRILGCNEMFTSLHRVIHLSLNYRGV